MMTLYGGRNLGRKVFPFCRRASALGRKLFPFSLGLCAELRFSFDRVTVVMWARPSSLRELFSAGVTTTGANAPALPGSVTRGVTPTRRLV